MTSHSAAVAVFEHHSQAEHAVKELGNAAFDITKINIVGKGCHTEEKVVGFYNAGDRINFLGEVRRLLGWPMGFVRRRLVHDRSCYRANRGARPSWRDSPGRC